MGTRSLVRIEECSGGRVVSFRAFGRDPEQQAWDKLREWAAGNLTDYAYRKCIGYAPQGHHPHDEGDDEHEYLAQMYLFASEGEGSTFRGADVADSPAGLFLLSDVPLDVICNSTGQPDIGESLKRTSRVMWECLKSIGGYDLNFGARSFIEEHVFPPEWFQGTNDPAEFRLWLPIRRL